MILSSAANRAQPRASSRRLKHFTSATATRRCATSGTCITTIGTAPGRLTRLMMPPLAHYLRMWDVTSATRVDSFVANSATVARRIHRYYGADSVVIHPPVDTAAFSTVRSLRDSATII